MKSQFAFPDKIIRQIFEPWVKSVQSRENLSVLNMAKREQLYFVADFRKYFRVKDFQILQLDLKGETIEDPKDLDNFLLKEFKSKLKKTILIILDADQLLEEKHSLLSHIDSLYHQQKNLAVIYLFQTNITSSPLINKLSHYTTLLQNVSIYSFYDKNSMLHFFSYTAQNFKVKIPSTLKEKILANCAGSPWLIKQAIRHYYQTGEDKGIFTSDAMNIKLNILYQELSAQEKSVIEKILKENYQFASEEKQTLEYLFKTKLVLPLGGKYQITIPVFEKFLRDKINSELQLKLNPSNQIILNNILVDSFFSRREKKIIKHLIQNKSKLVKREELAQLIWPDSSYSDWALDQIIRRLRNKLSKLSLSRSLIETVKNQGYRFNHNDLRI